MNHKEFLEKYKDIVFIPTVLEPPPFDLKKLYKWIEDNPNIEHEYYCTKFNLDMPSDEFYDMKWVQGNYSVFFKSYYVCDYELGWWNRSFNETFPEVLEWAKTGIPIKEGKRYQFGIVTQRSLEDLKEHGRVFSSSIHTDEEDIGIRWFFNNKNNNLFFYKTKVPVDDLKAQATDETRNSVVMFNKLTPEVELVMNEELKIPYASDNCYSIPIKIDTAETTGWYLNQYRAAHVIAHEMDNPEKITIILDAIGNKEHKWDWERLDNIMTESLEKYKDEAIFLDDFIDD